MSIIVEHHRAGGRVIVGVRAAAAATSESKKFSLLGQVSRISSVEKGCFMVEEGDLVINESGTNIMHKAINPNCLSDGLKRGVALHTVQYPFPEKFGSVRWCNACCYKTGTLNLHFEEIEAIGKTVFGKPKRRALKKKAAEEQAPRRTLKKEAAEEQAPKEPKKRGRPAVKVEASDASPEEHCTKRVKVKKEAAEPEPNGDQLDEDVFGLLDE